MALVDLVMPKLGESIMEATILKWLKKPGDSVRQDESVLEIATDKVDSEVPSVSAGTLEEILFQVNDVVPIGSVIARIRTNGASTQQAPAQQAPVTTYNPQPARPVVQTASNGAGSRFYSPLVLNIAASENVPLSELESIPGTGNEGRVTKKDILQYIADRKSGNAPASTSGSGYGQPARLPASVPMDNTPAPITYSTGNVEIIEMDRMRRLIADHMVRSKHTSPHVTSFSEADVT
ncbi:MAG TPA: biotin/lipoyl-containing protein, partial [Puia sp.]